MFRFNRKKCTCETTGVIVGTYYGADDIMGVYFKYTVNNTEYIKKESLSFQSSLVKVGGIPFGQRKVPRVNPATGTKVTVMYQPENPKKAYIKENTKKLV